MPKALLAVLVLALACLATLCTPLPSVVSAQIVFATTEPNVPRTLLGRPYRRHSEGTQSCPRARLTVADHNGADSDGCPYLDPNDGSCSQTETKMKTGTRTSRKQRDPPPLPLVLNTFPEAGSMRLRMRRPAPLMPILCIKGVWDKGERRATSRVESTPQ
ncbi:hypothetical protein JVU11DRAFT_131 [Chiua virens]|nr:hypothetical protein JVU11DRAFT_131 [Chiua virens]